MSFGNKKLEGGHAASHGTVDLFAIHAAPSTGKEKNTIRQELIPVACWRLDDVRFDFDSSFVIPQAKPEFVELAGLHATHKGSPYTIFGHADPVGDDAYNKTLSGRRARAIYGVLLRDSAVWEQLYANPNGTGDQWGLRHVQIMLTAVGFPAGTQNGSATAQSTQAIRNFQTANGLSPDGSAGPKTREVLFQAYFDFLSGPTLAPTDFLARGAHPDGKGDLQGCSEFNPVMMFSAAENTALNSNKPERNRQNAVNRRVLVLLLRPGTVVAPGAWPCPSWKEGATGCTKRFFANAAERRQFQNKHRTVEVDKDTFACRFYERLLSTSPCEGPRGTPIILEQVNPLILFETAVATPAPAADGGVKLAQKTAPSIAATQKAVLVKRPYTNPAPVKVTLKTDAGFTGTGTFTLNNNHISFKRPGAAASLQFDGIDNVFPGADLTAGVDLEATGLTASTAEDDVELTLTLAGGGKINGAPVISKMTSVELRLDICDPRTDAGTDPVALPTALTPPASGAVANDKFFLGRPLPLQTDPKLDERAKLIVRQAKPATFKGRLVLAAENDQVALFDKEEPESGETAKLLPLTFTADTIPAQGLEFFVEGAKPSTAARQTGITLGLEGGAPDGDHVKITVCHTEIVSNKKPADLKLVAQVPEKPERKTESTFVLAPLIVGLKYDVQMRPFIKIAVPSVFQWKTASAGVTLKDTAKEVVGCQGTALSTKLNDVRLELFLTTDIGKLKKRHELTVVHVEINPVIFNDSLKPGDDINFIRNPAGCVILTGADAGNASQVPKYEITKIEPDLAWTDDDQRISWWIVGGEAKADEKYDGKADFRNDDTAKFGKKIQVFGQTLGDILIQPYSGGYGYGMCRAHVIPLQKVKYRVNRIFTVARPAHPAITAQPEQLPQDPFPGHGAIAPQPAVPHLVAVDARPVQTPLDKHEPTTSAAEIQHHFAIVNIYLRQAGIEMIPDDSAEVASPARPARTPLPAVAAQPAIIAQDATPALPGPPPFPAQPAVPARPAVPDLPAVTARPATVVNNQVGQPGLDAFVESVTLVAPGIFDVEVNDQSLTFQASDPRSRDAIRINARNEVVTFAYIESQATAGALATAMLCPANHAPLARANPPRAYSKASYTMTDKSTPSSSLIPKTGIPDNVPVDQVKMVVLFPDVAWQGSSPATRDINLLWGVIMPTSTIDTSPAAPIDIDKIRLAYGNTMAHELGHVFGLGHRGGGGVPDGLMIPANENLMHPSNPPPRAQNIDIIQVKAMRFSEAFFRTP